MKIATEALVIAMFAALPLQAQTASVAIFPPEASCFRRDYNVVHLAKHPEQRITSISLTSAAGQVVSDLLVVDIAVKLRGVPETYVGSAYCEPDSTGLSCGMEGDAGAFTLRLAKQGALLLVVDNGGMSFEGGSDFITLSGNSGDDREFLMQPLPSADCR